MERILRRNLASASKICRELGTPGIEGENAHISTTEDAEFAEKQIQSGP